MLRKHGPRTVACTGLACKTAMNLHQIQAFLTVAETGNISRAAALLDVAQSVVSRHIQALEAGIGCRLFERTGRGVALTDIAELLAPKLRAALDSMHAATAEAAEHSGKPRGVVRLGLVPAAARPLAGLLTRTLARSAPGIALQFVEGFSNPLEDMLANGGLDLAIVNRYGTGQRRGDVALCVVDSHVIGPPNTFSRSAATITLAELAALPLVLAARPNGLRVELDQICRRSGVVLDVKAESDSLLVMKDLLVQNAMFTLLPRQAVHEELRHGLLSAARLLEPDLPRRLCLLTGGREPRSLAVQATARAIKALVRRAEIRRIWMPRSEPARPAFGTAP